MARSIGDIGKQFEIGIPKRALSLGLGEAGIGLQPLASGGRLTCAFYQAFCALLAHSSASMAIVTLKVTAVNRFVTL